MSKNATFADAGSTSKVGNGGITKDAEIKAPLAYFDPEFNARNAWLKYRYVAYDQLE
jgi:hypothetical protein